MSEIGPRSIATMALPTLMFVGGPHATPTKADQTLCVLRLVVERLRSERGYPGDLGRQGRAGFVRVAELILQEPAGNGTGVDNC